jgi:hypothetical protein
MTYRHNDTYCQVSTDVTPEEILRVVNGTSTIYTRATAYEAESPPDDDIPGPTDAEIESHYDRKVIPGPGYTPPRERKLPSAPIRRFLTMSAFMATYVIPDYLVEGFIQRNALQSLTARTGHGKTAVIFYLACMIAAGRNIGNLEVTQGSVLFLAGENANDVCGRVHAACEFYKLDPVKTPITVLPGSFPLTTDEAEKLRQDIDATGQTFALIIVDSAAAFFSGDDENHNVQAGTYARNLRVLLGCRGNPGVVVLCHPTKNAGQDSLLPRGGGSFLAEVDANLTLWSAEIGVTTKLHWQGKICGQDFQPVDFALHSVAVPGKTDKKGRQIMSVVATVQTAAEAEKVERKAITDCHLILTYLRDEPGNQCGKHGTKRRMEEPGRNAAQEQGIPSIGQAGG